MRCEDIMLSKTGHSQKDKDCVKEVYELSSQTPRKKYNGNFQELEEWGWRLLFKGTQFQVEKMKDRQMDDGSGRTTLQMYLMPLSCMLKNGCKAKIYTVYILSQRGKNKDSNTVLQVYKLPKCIGQATLAILKTKL